MNKLNALTSLFTMKWVTLEPSFIINRHQIYISATPSYVTVDCWTLVVLSGLLIVTIIPCLNDSHVDTVLSVSHNLLLKSSRTGLRIHVLWPCVLYFVCVCVFDRCHWFTEKAISACQRCNCRKLRFPKAFSSISTDSYWYIQ